MKLHNAIKKIEKEGYKVEKVGETLYRSIIGENQDAVLEFFSDGRGERIHCIGVRSINQHSDPQTDYCAFVFYPNLTKALRFNA